MFFQFRPKKGRFSTVLHFLRTKRTLATAEHGLHSFSSPFHLQNGQEFYSCRQPSVWIYYILIIQNNLVFSGETPQHVQRDRVLVASFSPRPLPVGVCLSHQPLGHLITHVDDFYLRLLLQHNLLLRYPRPASVQPDNSCWPTAVDLGYVLFARLGRDFRQRLLFSLLINLVYTLRNKK